MTTIGASLTDREREALAAIGKVEGYVRPNSIVSDAAHARALRTLAEKGLVERRSRSRKNAKIPRYMYRITDEGRKLFAEEGAAPSTRAEAKQVASELAIPTPAGGDMPRPIEDSDDETATDQMVIKRTPFGKMVISIQFES
jgi:DNA-binding PadR family transcriptional regulator